MSFHEERFPTEVSHGAQGGPERRTEVVVLGSGYEERNTRWADSRRTYNAGYGMKSLADLYTVINFFEERRGRFHGFRWRDPMDWKSCAPNETPAPDDQVIGNGDGVTASFTLSKTYGTTYAPWTRVITKPQAGSIRIAVDGIEQTIDTQFIADTTTGTITFLPGNVPPADAVVTAGFAFDVPVRFDTDKLEVNVSGFQHGAIPTIPIIEIRI